MDLSARFRRNAFGWRSQPAIKRIKEAVPRALHLEHFERNHVSGFFAV
jgi:hypothetical protein